MFFLIKSEFTTEAKNHSQNMHNYYTLYFCNTLNKDEDIVGLNSIYFLYNLILLIQKWL